MNAVSIRSVMLIPLLLPSVLRGDDWSLHGETVVHFATRAEGREFLATSDRFVEVLSPFDRQSRVESAEPVSTDEYLAFVQEHVREWTPEEITRLTASLRNLKPKLAELQLPLPAAIWLIKTSGREEGMAAYCRRNGIVLPQGKLAQPADAVERLLTHELFHILSSHNPELRARCYELIGFRTVPPVQLPAALRSRKITNPDAPVFDAVIDLRLDGETIAATPVLYSSTEQFDTQRGGPFFKYLTFKLLVVAPQNGGWEPVLVEGKPRLLTPQSTPDYLKKIGENTGYIIHPDEILADNFVHLVHQTRQLRSPELVARLRDVLRPRTEP